MSIDNETRQAVSPPSLTIYREDVYVRPGNPSEGRENRTVIVRTTGTLAAITSALGLGIGGVTEFYGLAQVPAADAMGRPMPPQTVPFPIPAASLYAAFLKLEDRAWVEIAVERAVAVLNQRNTAASLRGGR